MNVSDSHHRCKYEVFYKLFTFKANFLVLANTQQLNLMIVYKENFSH